MSNANIPGNTPEERLQYLRDDLSQLRTAIELLSGFVAVIAKKTGCAPDCLELAEESIASFQSQIDSLERRAKLDALEMIRCHLSSPEG